MRALTWDQVVARRLERSSLDVRAPRERRQPSLLVDGRVAGVWRRTQRGRRVELLVEAFRRLTKAQQGALADDARRVAGTVGAEPVLELA